MPTYIVLGSFTEQGLRNIKDSPKRAEAVGRWRRKPVHRSRTPTGRSDNTTSLRSLKRRTM